VFFRDHWPHGQLLTPFLPCFRRPFVRSCVPSFVPVSLPFVRLFLPFVPVSLPSLLASFVPCFLCSFLRLVRSF
jgi:hypothetical protein